MINPKKAEESIKKMNLVTCPECGWGIVSPPLEICDCCACKAGNPDWSECPNHAACCGDDEEEK